MPNRNVSDSGDRVSFFGGSPVTVATPYTLTYSTADKTHSVQASTAITASVGTADGVMADVGTTFAQTALNNNFQECATAITNLSADLVDVKQLVNSVIQDFQRYGLL